LWSGNAEALPFQRSEDLPPAPIPEVSVEDLPEGQ
jgi:hypothetical protein